VGRCESVGRRTVAGWRKPSEGRFDPRRICKMQWGAVQGARFSQRRPGQVSTWGLSVRHETSCNLRDGGCFVLHSAHVTEHWRSRGFPPRPSLSVPGPTQSAGQVIIDRAVACASKATSPSPIHCSAPRITCGTTHAQGYPIDMNPDQHAEHVTKNR
jgi:hypothetical protein